MLTHCRFLVHAKPRAQVYKVKSVLRGTETEGKLLALRV